jgi:metallo-beta-lactamase class B
LAANTYYVGTCGISAILVTGSKGGILIDGGPANAARLIARNIEALGFRLTDVKILLHSHEHHDHVGGLAELQRLTGARLLASPEAAPVLASGQADAADPQFDEHASFPAARVDGIVKDDDVVTLGDLALHAVATPGHTPGALSWYWNASPGGDKGARIVYADSLTPVSSAGYRFSDHTKYLAAFRASLAKIAALGCRNILSPHPSASGMRANVVTHGYYSATPTACKDYAGGLSKRLDERLSKEADGK